MQSISNQHGAVVKIPTGQIILCSTNFSNETMNPYVKRETQLKQGLPTSSHDPPLHVTQSVVLCQLVLMARCLQSRTSWIYMTILHLVWKVLLPHCIGGLCENYYFISLNNLFLYCREKYIVTSCACERWDLSLYKQHLINLTFIQAKCCWSQIVCETWIRVNCMLEEAV